MYLLWFKWICCCLVTKSCLTLLRPHGLQLAKPPCPSVSPGVCSDSCPFSHWFYLAITLSAALFSFCLQSFPARVFSSEWSLCIRWQKYWNFNFIISLSKEYSGLISFRIDWFDLLAIQGTLKSLIQHHSSKASILQHKRHIVTHIYTFYVHNFRLSQMKEIQPWVPLI